MLITAKVAGPEDAGELLDRPEEPEELARLVARDQAGEQRAAQGLRPPLHRPDQDGQDQEVRAGGHEVADDADPRVDQPAPGRSTAWRRSGRPASRRGTRRGCRRTARSGSTRSMAPWSIFSSVRVDGGHPHDRADAVVVDQEGQQHDEGLAIAAQGSRPVSTSRARRPGSAGRSRPHIRAADRCPAAPARGGTAGSRRPATRSRRTGTTAASGAWPGLAEVLARRQPEPLRLQDPGQVERQQEPAAEVSQRVARPSRPGRPRRRGRCGASRAS